MMAILRSLVPAAAALALLAGCGKQADKGSQASGQVLEGTISDAMIETDRIRSEPPLAPGRAEGADKPGPAPDRPKAEASAAPEIDDAVSKDAEQPGPPPTQDQPEN